MVRTLIFALTFVATLVSPLWAADHQLTHHGKVRIGIFQLEPISFVDENQQAQGLNPDLLRKIAAEEGWEPIFVPGSWGEGIDRLEADEIDLMMNVAYTEERAQKLDYSYEPSLQLWGQVFIRPDSNIESISDLSGRKVAIQRRGINGRNFKKTAQQLGIECDYVTYENLVEVFTAVQKGEVAAGVSPQHYGLRNAGKYGLVPSSIQFSPFPIYFATKKGMHRLLLSQIDSYLIRWKENKDSYYYQRLNHWMGNQADEAFVPKWLLHSLYSIGAAALLFLSISLIFKAEVKKKTGELREANRNLTSSESRYRSLIDSMIQPMGLYEIIYDENRTPLDARLLDVNPTYASLFDRPAREMIGLRVSELFDDFKENWLQAMAEVAETGTAKHFDTPYQVFGRFYDLVAYSPTRGQFAVIATDITERIKMQEEQRKLEEQILHAQKLESLGVLAGGIAHDFNNILMAVLGHCELALRRLTPESPARQNLEEIRNSANRAADLANQMLAYSGKGKFIIEPLDLSKVAGEMEQMLEVSVKKKAIVRYQLTENLPSVEADATQLRQIILNLALNASDAIGNNSGVIAITTGVLDCSEEYLRESWLDEQLPAGQYVFLEVADTGCGMSKETINRIFEPFFTTKFSGRGLGMAAVLGIVRGHHGAIKVYSEAGKGTTFKVLLPTSTKSPVLFNISKETKPLQGSGTVLLVDDDETVRSIGREMLEEFGYTVVTADDGREALDKYRQHGEISFVLMDLTMPHMDGEQAFRELKRIDPAVKVIMSSGYNEQEIAQKFAGKGVSGFLKKPYQLSVLQQEIQALES